MRSNDMNIAGLAYKKSSPNGGGSIHLMELLDHIEGFNRLTNYDDLIAAIGDAIKTVMKAEASTLLLLDEEDELSVAYAAGPSWDELRGQSVPKDEGFCGWVAEHKIPLIANDLSRADEILYGVRVPHFTARNLISAPLLDSKNNVMGIMQAVNCREKPRLNEQDIPVFQALANHAGTAIERMLTQKGKEGQMHEQDMYLTEVHHRVKNDLALISGIVEIESLDIEDEDAKQVLKNIQSRIKSMAVVYELLSGEGSHDKAEVGTYFKKLVSGISDSLRHRNQSIDIEVNAESVVIDPYKALSCGLILNELLLNSYKHAFDTKESGLITIDLNKTGTQIIITYRDDGHGLPENFELDEQESLGFKMIDALVKQLDGSLEINNDNGAHFVIKFQSNENAGKKEKAVLNG